MLSAKKIGFLTNLTQIKYEDQYFDFHNDYDCENIVLNEKSTLTLQFRNSDTDDIVLFQFKEAIITRFHFFNGDTVKHLTIDNIYRGKTVIDHELVEYSYDKGYFYLEFYEGQKIELWSNLLSIEKI